jgi:hypothetical protein
VPPLRRAALALVLCLAACAPPLADRGRSSDEPAAATPREFTLIAAGDIGQCGEAGARLTGRLLDRLGGRVLATGDLAYARGSDAEFRDCFDPFWGRHKPRLAPVPGNHDYATAGAAAYFRYFGGQAAPPGGYYSFEAGSWHVVALNSNIDARAGSPQERWLAEDLGSVPAGRCILAFFHHTYVTSGYHGRTAALGALVADLYRFGVSIVLTGHDHHYERFAAVDVDGAPDRRGARWFVVGTGGATLYPAPLRIPGSEVAAAQWGVLGLDLREGGYAWEFVPVEGGDFHDRGNDRCRPKPA